MLISKIATNPLLYQNKQLSVAGVVRATYEKPFPFFMLEDQTGTLFCQTNSELPVPGAHIKVDGKFFVGIPEKCSVPLALLEETSRSYVGHSRPCSIKACDGFDRYSPLDDTQRALPNRLRVE